MPATDHRALVRLLGVLSSPIEGRIVVGPNWFASVMGTGIVAVAGATLPIAVPALLTTTAWVLAVVALLVLLVVMPLTWLTHTSSLRDIANDAIAIQFFGAPPMALMTVASATVLVGQRYLGESLAVTIGWSLWAIGTVLGFIAAVAVPYRLFTRLEVHQDAAFGGWLMPVVPPMVSASVGAILLPYAPAGEVRQSLLMVCYACFGMSLMASVIIITLIWSRLAYFGTSGSARVPTLWIVLGPVGQSITAAGALGAVALQTVDPPLSTALDAFAVVFGVPMFGFMVLWMPMAAALTWRAHRRNMGFALTWWSFTFPVGTCVTGTSQLARHTGLAMFDVIAVTLYGLLLTAWLVVVVRTFQHSRHGELLSPPAVSVHPTAQKG